MNVRKLGGLLLLVAIVALGISVLVQPASLGLETTARDRAVRQMAAPGGGMLTQTEPADYSQPVAPVAVNLSEVKPTARENMEEKYLRGEIDFNNEFRATPDEMEAFLADAMALPASADIQDAALRGSGAAPTLLNSFDSIDSLEQFGVPPDPHMAAGPNHLIAVVNSSFQIYDKTGTALSGIVEADAFLGVVPVCNGTFDPTVVYDEESDRFGMVWDANGTHMCVAVTQTGDPVNDPWWVYGFAATPFGGEFFDYPHTGVGDNYIVVGSNQFGGGVPGGFEGRVWAMNKADLYAGDPVTLLTESTTIDFGTPQPLMLHGFLQGTWPAYGDTHYFVTDLYDGCTMQVWEWDIGTSAPTIISTVDLCAESGVAAVGQPVPVPQLGTTSTLEGNDWRMRMFEYRNGSGWVNDSISCNPGGGTVNCLRWVELDLTVPAPTAVQAGVYASDGEYRTFGDLAVNTCGDMAIGYTKSSADMYAGVWYTGRESTDPPGALAAEAELKAGEVPYESFDGTPYRWGDYSAMTIDPDGVTFWYIGEYSKDITNFANWGNYIGEFSYQNCGTEASFTMTTTPASQDVCSPNDAVFTVDTNSILGFTDPIDLDTMGAPGTPSFSVDPVSPGSSSDLTISGAAAGMYTFDVTGDSGAISRSNTVMLNVFDAAPTAPTLTNPADGASDVSGAPTYMWDAVAGATSYTIEVATDMAFTNIVDSATVDTNSYEGVALLGATTYYWRVTADNVCGDATSAISSFTTADTALACGTTAGFEDGALPSGWFITTNADAGGEWLVSTDNSSDFFTIPPAPEGIYYASANDDAPGSGSDGSADFLYTNVFDLTTGNGTVLMFDYFFTGAFGQVAGGVEVSGDGGATWDGEMIVPTGTTWQGYMLDLSAYDGNATVQVRFHSDDGGFWASGYAVDNVTLNCEAPPLPGACEAGTSPNTVFFDDFESGAAGWTSGSNVGPNTWALGAGASPSGPISGANVYNAVNVDEVSDQLLVSPPIALPTGESPLTLQFYNWQEIEDSATGCWDGGVLEVTTDAGATWIRLESELLTDPYDGPISTSFGNPLGGENAWCGDPANWINSLVDLDAFAGQTVQFRWRLATDSSVGRDGWDIDDVYVQSCEEDDVTAVEMAGIDAAVNADGSVTVNWTTSAEVNNAGFNVLRADSADATGAALNGNLIASAASAGSGAAYSYADATVGVGTYYYWVEAIATDGTAQVFGPVEVVTQAPTSAALSAFDGGSSTLLPLLLVAAVAVTLVAFVGVSRRRSA